MGKVPLTHQEGVKHGVDGDLSFNVIKWSS